MIELLTYLLKVSLAISLLVIPYYLFLRDDAYLHIKRLYLFGGIILSWTFPLMIVSKPGIVQGLDPTFIIDPGVNASIALPSEIQSGFNFSWLEFLAGLYILGMAYFLARSVNSYYKAIRLRTKQISGQKNLVISNSEQVFTIFPKIFLPKKYSEGQDINSILIHEKAHIHQLHFIDLLLVEATILFTWFNPFSWLISRMIKENHEHLADRSVLRQGVNPAHYKALLLNHAMGGQVFRLGHQFNHSLTKKRFEMMKKIRVQKKGIVKYILFIPLILTFMLVITANAQQAKTIQGKVFLESMEDPAIGAAIVVAGTTQGTVVDMQGNFSLSVEGNPQLVISFIGYETKKLTAKEASVKPIILKATTYTFSFDEIDKAKSLEIKPENLESKLLSLEEAEPVIIVDGKKVNSIDHLNAEDIEMVEVLKDQNNPIVKKFNAKDGLVIITTKQKPLKEEDLNPPDGKEVFYVVEEMPSFPGGKLALRNYILENLNYPPEAKKKNISGEVMVKFKVTHSGDLKDIEVVQSSNKILNEAAMDIFRDMPAWNPGKQRGKPVSAKVIVPVRFQAEQE